MQNLAYNIFGASVMSKIYYRIIMGRTLNLHNPNTFSEKVCWYKLFECPNNELIIKCSDKYKVREYICGKGLGEYLPKLIGEWKNVDEIDFDQLPNEFALKCNHGCAYNIICDDKTKLDYNKVRNVLKEWVSESFGRYNAEPHYDKIERRVICEEYLDSSKGFLPIDYKIHCFNNEPRFLLECSDREKGHPRLLFYTLYRKPLDCGTFKMSMRTLDITQETLDKMCEISRKISKDFSFVRVDFYILNDKPIIGELSFSPAAGYINYLSDKGDRLVGEMWGLSTQRRR